MAWRDPPEHAGRDVAPASYARLAAEQPFSRHPKRHVWTGVVGERQRQNHPWLVLS